MIQPVQCHYNNEHDHDIVVGTEGGSQIEDTYRASAYV